MNRSAFELHVLIAIVMTSTGLGFGRSFAGECTNTPLQRVTATDGSQIDFHEASVAIDGGTAVIGAPGDSTLHGPEAGAAYIYVNRGGTWVIQDRIVDPNGEAFNRFGSSVAIDGDTIVVGSPLAGAGSAAVFVRTGERWAWQATLAPDGLGPVDRFGRRVAISGDTAAVSAPNHAGPPVQCGAVFVFQRQEKEWTLEQRLIDPDAAFADEFGKALAIDGDVLAVGSPSDDENGRVNCGSARAFHKVGGLWTARPKLTAPDGDPGDLFGASIDVEDGLLIVGAPQSSYAPLVPGGGAYVFVVTNGVWSFQNHMLLYDADESDDYGAVVAIDTATAGVGAVAMLGSSLGDRVAVFAEYGGTWADTLYGAHLHPIPSRSSEFFVAAIDADGGTVVVATLESNSEAIIPSADFFSLTCPPCPADITGDAFVNVSDLLMVISNWGNCPSFNPCHSADIVPPGGDGIVRITDLLAVINDWGPCP